MLAFLQGIHSTGMLLVICTVQFIDLSKGRDVDCTEIPH